MLTLPPDQVVANASNTPPSLPDILNAQTDAMSAAQYSYTQSATVSRVGNTQVINPTDPELQLQWIKSVQVVDPSDSTSILSRTFHVLQFAYDYAMSWNHSPDSAYQTDLLYCVTAHFNDNVYAAGAPDFIRWQHLTLPYSYTKLYQNNKVGSTSFIEAPKSTGTADSTPSDTPPGNLSSTHVTTTTTSYIYESPAYIGILICRGTYPGAIITCNTDAQIYLLDSPSGYINPASTGAAPPPVGTTTASTGDKTVITSSRTITTPGATALSPTTIQPISPPAAPVVATITATPVAAVVTPGTTGTQPTASGTAGPILLTSPYILIWADVCQLETALQVRVDWYGQFLFTEVSATGGIPDREIISWGAATSLTDRLVPPGNVPVDTNFPAAPQSTPVQWGANTPAAGVV